MYRISEKKLKQISEIEYLLKITSIDCNLNIEENRFISDYYKKSFRMITSKNTEHNLSINDIDNSKLCNFKKCDFKCDPDLSKFKNEDVDVYTFDFTKIPDTIFEIRQIIKNLYKKNMAYTLDQIKIEYFLTYSKENEDLLLYSLNELIKKEEVFSNLYGKLGVIKKQGQYYIFMPLYLKDQFTSFSDLRTPITKKIRLLDITDLKELKTSKQELEISNIKLVKSIKITSHFKTTKLQLLNDKKYDSEDFDTLSTLFRTLMTNSNFMYDFLVPNDKEIVIKYIILTIKTKGLSKFSELDKIIIKAVDKNILYMKRDVDTNYDKQDYIWGYKIAKNNSIEILKYDNKNFISPTLLEKKNILKNINIKIKAEPKPSTIIGYLEYKQSNNTINLKIRDKTKEGKKGTQIKTGSICGNDGMKKNKIIDFIEKTLEDDKYSDEISKNLPGKHNLCFELELYLRNNDLVGKNSLRWFYNLEETIEREINKKIY